MLTMKPIEIVVSLVYLVTTTVPCKAAYIELHGPAGDTKTKYMQQEDLNCTAVPPEWGETFTSVKSDLPLLLYSEINCTGQHVPYRKVNSTLGLFNLNTDENSDPLKIKSWFPVTHPLDLYEIGEKENGDNTGGLIAYTKLCGCINVFNATKNWNEYVFPFNKCVKIYNNKYCKGEGIELTTKEDPMGDHMIIKMNEPFSEKNASFQLCQPPQHCRFLQGTVQKFDFVEPELLQNFKLNSKIVKELSISNSDSGKRDLGDLGKAEVTYKSVVQLPLGLHLLDKLQVSTAPVNVKYLVPVVLNHEVWLTAFKNLHEKTIPLPARDTAHLLPPLNDYFPLGINRTLLPGESVNVNVSIYDASHYVRYYSLSLSIQGEFGNGDGMLASDIKNYLLLNEDFGLIYVETIDSHRVLAMVNCSIEFKFPFSTRYNITSN